MKPFPLSIAIPVHDGANYICEAIDSALQQRTPVAEVLVRNNASTDRTASLLSKYDDAPHFRAISSPDLIPIFPSWDAAIRATTGEWVVLLPHDDRLHSDFVTQVAAIVKSNPSVDWIINCGRLVDKTGAAISVSPESTQHGLSGLVTSQDLLDVITQRGMFFVPPGVVFRRSFYERLGGFDLRYPYAADWDFYIRASLAGRAYVQPKPLVDFRIHPKQATNRFLIKDHGDADVMFDKLKSLGPTLTSRQIRQLVTYMTSGLRRTITHEILRTDHPHTEISMNRGRVISTLSRWRRVGWPGSRYVSRMPGSVRQSIVWYAARYAWSTAVLRTLLGRGRNA